MLSPILQTGPAAGRLNFVLYAEGYTAADRAKFEKDAAAKVGQLVVIPPFGEHAGLMNFWGCWVESRESGSSKLLASPPIHRDTAFRSAYGFAGVQRLVGLLQALKPSQLAAFAPGIREHHIILVNDSERGAGSFGSLTTCSRGASAYDLAHELGHAAGLGEGYSTAVKGYVPQRAHNVALSLSDIPWQDMLTPGVPIPTPATAAFANVVGVFKGADSSSSAYRPSLNCNMRTSGKPFDPVACRALLNWFKG